MKEIQKAVESKLLTEILEEKDPAKRQQLIYTYAEFRKAVCTVLPG